MRFSFKYFLGGLLIGSAGMMGCSGGNDMPKARVDGKITVADSVDNSKDYAGIGVTIIKKDSANADADTLFHAITNKNGEFSGKAEFPHTAQYPVLISRNKQNIGQAGVILAKGDTVHITAQLPGIAKTIDIKSHEHEALESYRRVDKSFARVAAYIEAGKLTGDSLRTEMQKWPDIYWQVYEKNPHRLAGELAAKKTIALLNQLDKQKMMEKIHAIEDDDDLVFLAATYGKDYLAETQHLDKTLSYLKKLENNTKKSEAQMRIQMEKIDLLYDSNRVERARNELKSFNKEFDKNKAAKEWAKSVEYDLNYLSPGDAVPEFSFRDNGKEVNRENLKGHPYLLEITALSNPIYQQQYDRTVVIHSLYKNFDFKVITIPLDTSQVTVNAFFDERVRPWPVAPANAFDPQKLIKRFNISILPTRFLINRQGRIVRRYTGHEYEDVIQGIQKIIKTNQ